MCITGCSTLRAIPRFLAKLETTEDGCRVWTGAQTRGGVGCYKIKKHKKLGKRLKGKPRPNHNSPRYGKFWVGPDDKDTVNAHVFAAWLKGLIPTLRVPAGMHLAHSCKHGSLCMDCIRLVPAEVNLHEARTAPLRAPHRPTPSEICPRLRRAIRKRVTRKFSPAAKTGLTQEANASTV